MKGNLTGSLNETLKEFHGRFMAKVQESLPSKKSSESWTDFLSRCWNEFLASLDLEDLRSSFFKFFGGWLVRLLTSWLEKLGSFLNKKKP